MNTNKLSTTTSTLQRTIAHALVMINDPTGQMASAYIEEARLLSFSNDDVENGAVVLASSSSPDFPLRSCLKSKRCTEDCSRSLPSQLDYHVHFDTEKESRWSNGCPRCKAQPLKYKKRSIGTTKIEVQFRQ